VAGLLAQALPSHPSIDEQWFEESYSLSPSPGGVWGGLYSYGDSAGF